MAVITTSMRPRASGNPNKTGFFPFFKLDYNAVRYSYLPAVVGAARRNEVENETTIWNGNDTEESGSSIAPLYVRNLIMSQSLSRMEEGGNSAVYSNCPTLHITSYIQNSHSP